MNNHSPVPPCQHIDTPGIVGVHFEEVNNKIKKLMQIKEAII
jgi:hypothetical protein